MKAIIFTMVTYYSYGMLANILTRLKCGLFPVQRDLFVKMREMKRNMRRKFCKIILMCCFLTCYAVWLSTHQLAR